MPTPHEAFSAVASALADINPEDQGAVARFYSQRFGQYPKPVQALISDFLIGQTGEPSEADLMALKRTVALPLNKIPAPQAPELNRRDHAQARR